MNSKLTGLGAEQISTDADVVAEVEQFVEFKALVADGVFFDVDLELLAVLLEMGKSCFAHQSNGHNATRNANVHARIFELFGGLFLVLADNLRDGMSKFVSGGIRRLAESFDLLELFQPQL